MKTPRIAVVVANMKNERDLLIATVDLTPEEIRTRIEVLTQCIEQLEPPKGNFDSKYDVAPKVTRNRKPKPDAATEPTL